MAENFPSLGKETDAQVQEARTVPNKINIKRPTQRHIILKMSNVKDKRVLKGEREQQLLLYKETPIRLSDISAEPLQARREWHNIFKVIKEKNFLAKLLFRIEGEIEFCRQAKN